MNQYKMGKLAIGGEKINNTAYDATIIVNPKHSDRVQQRNIWSRSMHIFL